MKFDKYYIDIKRVRVYAYHGVLPVERRVGNEFEVSARIEYDASRAISTDSLAHALNYADAVKVIEHEMGNPSDLLEHVAGRIARGLCAHFQEITAGSVTVTKLHPPVSSQMESVSFTVHFQV